MLSREQICDLLWELGASEVIDHSSNKWIRFTCTVHKEEHPSAGVNVEHNIFNCFACGASGTLDWLCYLSDKDRFKSVMNARKWLEKRYHIKFNEVDEDTIHQTLLTYDELQEKKRNVTEKETHKVLPIKTLAPYRSGKETYKYFFKRGFTKQTMIDFKIGRDVTNKTVTIPVFYEDGKLAGIVGRYISKNRRKNERYRVYEFEKSHVTFPQNKLEVIDDTIILVEGILDALWLHQLGFTNAQAILGNKLSPTQAKYLKSKASKFIRMFDNDVGGASAKKAYDKYMADVTTYDVIYPEGCKDPQECNKEQIETMLQGATSKLKIRFKMRK